MNSYTIILIALLMSINSCVFAKESDKTVKASSIEKSILKGKDIRLSGLIIEGDIDFTELVNYYTEGRNVERGSVSSSITFVNCTFPDKIIAFKRENKIDKRISFLKNITFINCSFSSDIMLKEVVVHGIANFVKNSFDGIINIEGADFRNQDNYFTECVFNDKIKAQRTRFNGNVSFLKSEFFALADFQQAVFNGKVQFGACKFYDHADFSLIKATDNFIMNYAEFNKKSIMNNSNYMGRVEFQQASFYAAIEMKGNTYAYPVKLNNVVIEADFSVENSYFLSGLPELDNLKNDSLIDFSKAYISTIKEMK